MKPKSCTAKGRRFQREVRTHFLRIFGLADGDVRTAIGSENGADIKCTPSGRALCPYTTEAKNTERLNVWKAWKQAQGHCEGEPGIPLLIVRRNRTEPLVIMSLAEFERLWSK